MNYENDQNMMNFLANEIAKTYMQGKVGSMEEFANAYMDMYEKSLKVIKSRNEKKHGSLEYAVEYFTKDMNNNRYR